MRNRIEPFDHVLGVWGDEGTRVVAAEAYWQLPHKWNRQAEAEGRRHRVFCLSLGDWLEDRPELIMPRARLLYTIARTPHLDWQLLTKRPEGWHDRMAEIAGMNPAEPFSLGTVKDWLYRGTPPANVWFGISVEDQQRLDERWPHAAQVPAVVHFLSAEPLLGPLQLTCPRCAGRLRGVYAGHGGWQTCPDCNGVSPLGERLLSHARVSWVITGGESGPGARPCHPQWLRDIRDQCVAAGVAYFHKQNGEWAHAVLHPPGPYPYRLLTPEGNEREAGEPNSHPGDVLLARFGKHRAGRLLDGREHNEFPKV